MAGRDDDSLVAAARPWLSEHEHSAGLGAVQERELNDGEIVYRVGERADAVYSVISGFIILRRPTPGGSSREQLLGPGAVFGVADVMGGAVRAAEARAHGHATITAHMPEEIINAILDRPEAADAMVASVLAARRRDAEAAAEEESLHTIGRSRITLVPLDSAVKDQLGEPALLVEEFPFVIGRRSDGLRTGVTLPVSLALIDRPPFKLSRRHFAIEREDGRYVVRDCRSYHGTIVNGRTIGARAETYRAELAPGENEIIAGPARSPFRFVCIVPASPTA